MVWSSFSFLSYNFAFWARLQRFVCTTRCVSILAKLHTRVFQLVLVFIPLSILYWFSPFFILLNFEGGKRHSRNIGSDYKPSCCWRDTVEAGNSSRFIRGKKTESWGMWVSSFAPNKLSLSCWFPYQSKYCIRNCSRRYHTVLLSPATENGNGLSQTRTLQKISSRKNSKCTAPL